MFMIKYIFCVCMHDCLRCLYLSSRKQRPTRSNPRLNTLHKWTWWDNRKRKTTLKNLTVIYKRRLVFFFNAHAQKTSFAQPLKNVFIGFWWSHASITPTLTAITEQVKNLARNSTNLTCYCEAMEKKKIFGFNACVSFGPGGNNREIIMPKKKKNGSGFHCTSLVYTINCRGNQKSIWKRRLLRIMQIQESVISPFCWFLFIFGTVNNPCCSKTHLPYSGRTAILLLTTRWWHTTYSGDRVNL